MPEIAVITNQQRDLLRRRQGLSLHKIQMQGYRNIGPVWQQRRGAVHHYTDTIDAAMLPAGLNTRITLVCHTVIIRVNVNPWLKPHIHPLLVICRSALILWKRPRSCKRSRVLALPIFWVGQGLSLKAEKPVAFFNSEKASYNCRRFLCWHTLSSWVGQGLSLPS